MNVQAFEKAIVRKAIETLLASGFMLSVNDGEEETLTDSREVAEIFAAMFTTDEDWLFARMKGGSKTRRCWIRFIYGNDGYDVVNDYSTDLEPPMTEIKKLADDLEAGLFTVTPLPADAPERKEHEARKNRAWHNR